MFHPDTALEVYEVTALYAHTLWQRAGGREAGAQFEVGVKKSKPIRWLLVVVEQVSKQRSGSDSSSIEAM